MARLTAAQFAHLRAVVAFYAEAPDPTGGVRSEAADRERFFQAGVAALLRGMEAALSDRAAPAPELAAQASGILLHACGYAAAIALLGGSDVARRDGDRVKLATVKRFAEGFEDAFARQLGSAEPNAYEAARTGKAATGSRPAPGGATASEDGQEERRDYAQW